MKNEFYPELKYPAVELSAYSLATGMFVISLKSNEVIQFVPDDTNGFIRWLEKCGIRNVDEEDY